MKRIDTIARLDQEAIKRAEQRWDSIAKPLHSLGLLEKAISQIAGITGTEEVRLKKRCVIVMCADNGITAEGVTQTDSSVTRLVAESMADGKANISRMAAAFKADVKVVDIGMNTDSPKKEIIKAKSAYGTRNFAHEYAMTRKQAEESILAGIEQVRSCQEEGYDILLTGEMGIGNTTTASAIAAVVLGKAPEEVTGKGAGLSEQALSKKIAVIQQAIRMHQPDSEDAIDILCKVGGYDIAGMTGLFLGGAIYRMPIVIDGLISAAAAALAVKLAPRAKDYMLCSHVSKERAGKMMLDDLGMQPIIHAEMCLGEGTGAVLLLPLLDGALAVYHNAHHFDDLEMEEYKEQTPC